MKRQGQIHLFRFQDDTTIDCVLIISAETYPESALHKDIDRKRIEIP